MPQLGNKSLCLRKLLNGKCKLGNECRFAHGKITNHDKIAAWITGNNLPLTKRE
jgi:hypothetical protein